MALFSRSRHLGLILQPVLSVGLGVAIGRFEMDSTIDELKDLISCSVCLEEYDENQRKPKFLPCSHTICLRCLQILFQASQLNCPLCRQPAGNLNKNPIKLPNNQYAIHMIKSRNVPQSQEAERHQKWCLTCKTYARDDCATNHLAILIGSASLSEISRFHDLMNQYKNKVSQAIAEIQLVDNQRKLLLEGIANIAGDLGKNICRESAVPSSLLDILGDLNTQSIPIVRERLESAMGQVESSLHGLQRVSTEQHAEDQVRLIIELQDSNGKRIPTVPEFQQGFTRKEHMTSNSPTSLHLNLLSHMIFSYLNKRQVKIETRKETIHPARRMETSISRIGTSQPTFILQFWKRNLVIGQVQVKPAPTFNRSFIQQLSEFCYKRPATFLDQEITKAHRNAFVQICLQHPEFEPPVPVQWSVPPESTSGLDVVVSAVRSWNGKFRSLDLIFLLEAHQPSDVPSSSHYFGRIVGGRGIIKFLSGSLQYQPKKIRMTLEAV